MAALDPSSIREEDKDKIEELADRAKGYKCRSVDSDEQCYRHAPF